MTVPAEPTRRALLATLVLVALSQTWLVTDASGQAARKAAQPSLRTVRLSQVENDVATVVVESSGALPEPVSGVSTSPPPRVYLDFTDVLPTSDIGPVAPNPIVTRIRVAPHSADPLITRVVINLSKAIPYRIDASARSQGRILVILGAQASESKASTAAQQPARTATPPPTPSSSSGSGPPSRSSSATPPGSSPSRGRGQVLEDQYAVRVSSALLRLHALRPLLESIDRRADQVSGDLDAAAKEFDAIAAVFSAIKPPSSRQATHALLLRTCTLGARAVRLRQENANTNDPTAGWDAASAAAGALLMFDRANNELAVK